MALKCKAIGIGAAGNKAVIQLVKDKVLDRKSVMLLNTTKRDIPEEFKTDMAVEFGGQAGGCGKDRELAKQLMIDALSHNQIPIDDFIEGDEKFFTIVSSTEGGTGSGSSVVLGEYLRSITKTDENPDGIPVNMVSFCGFEDDTRGLKNTFDWFKDLSNDFVIQSISNRACLQFVEGNRRKAEEYANKIFSKRIEILSGKNLNPSDSNVDNMDLFKLNEIHGYMDIEYIDLDNIHDEAGFEEAITKMIGNSVSIPTDPSSKRLGVILTAPNKLQAIVDESYKQIIKAYGFPSEIFRHKQEPLGYNSSIAVIASGMKMPYAEIKGIYNRFTKAMEKTDLAQDEFFDVIGTMDTNIGMKTQVVGGAIDKSKMMANKSSFFAKYNVKKTTITLGEAMAKDEL